MSDVLRLSIATLRHQSRRYLAPGLAVVLGIAFIAATLVLTDTLSSSMKQSVAGQYERYSAVVAPAEDADELPASLLDEVTTADGVESVDAIRQSGAMMRAGSGELYSMVTTAPENADHEISAGREPRTRTEVMLDESTADSAQVEVGDTVPFTSFEEGERSTDATVVGIVDVGKDPRYGPGMQPVFATPEGVTALTGASGWTELDVVGGPDEESLATAVEEAVSQEGVETSTATEYADDQVAALTGGTDMIGAFMLAFAVIALFVSAIVIGNTFSILLARRARETALLRTVGSTRGQVVRSALLEALVVALVFSGLGVLAGIGLARALVVAGETFGGDALPEIVFTVPLRAVVVPLAVGLVVVLVAALRPVLRASRVAPLEALRPDAAVTARSRRGILRIVAGLVLMGLGAGALVLAATQHVVEVGVAGGLLSFTGVLLAASALVPAVARAVGVIAARPFGVPGRLAVENAVRNPARAAATASALLVGVTLVTMTAVGAATTKTVVSEIVDEQYPVDVIVSGSEIDCTSSSALEDVDGVDTTALVSGSTVDAPKAGVRDQAVGVLPDGAETVARDAEALPSPEEGEVVLSEEAASTAGVDEGDEISLAGADGTVDLRVAVDGRFEGWLVTEAAMADLDTSAPSTTMLLRLEDSADVSTTMTDIQQVAGGIEGATVDGAAPTRDANMNALDTALAVVLALLGISVIIAVVGIANTLSLSVIERTRESALMRALGLTRGQLRRMLAVEAVLLALVGVLVGGVLGTVYALSGVSALLGEHGSVTPQLPWGQLALVAVVAVVAGLLASVLPARRAARVAPSAALAAE